MEINDEGYLVIAFLSSYIGNESSEEQILMNLLKDGSEMEAISPSTHITKACFVRPFDNFSDSTEPTPYILDPNITKKF